VGYIFTESVIHRLSESGFSFYKNDATLKSGYIQFILPISEIESLEFRQILDEDLYFKSQNKKDFSPFISEIQINIELQTHPNTITSISCLVDQDFEDSELKTFLQIRKRHSIWAVILNCTDFEKFKKMANPENFTTWQNKTVAVIHLGSACFDLVVQNKI